MHTLNIKYTYCVTLNNKLDGYVRPLQRIVRLLLQQNDVGEGGALWTQGGGERCCQLSVVVDVVQGNSFTWSLSDDISKRRRQAGLTHFDPLDLR